ncbi:MAG: glycosyltransferase [Candidatus Cloacimonetes bacterium]|nr:glycosyltransferase [Candidatus Cloacimonadota bacterium]
MKRFLILTYYWPPCGGVSVQRWLKLTKYFLNNNWLPTVLTTENGDYPNIDISLLKQVSEDIEVVRTKPISYSRILTKMLGKAEKLPYASLQTSKKDTFLKRIIYFFRIQFVAPDARVVWNNQAFKTAENLIKTRKYDLVITTGPPHSTHLIGSKLKKKYGINWIADFRDPWSKIHYHQNVYRNKLIKFIDKNFESKALKSSSAVVAVSKHVAQTLGIEKSIIIPNGFDPDDFLSKNYTKSNKFRIKFVGALFEERKEVLLKTLDWIDEYATKNKILNIEFSLIGAYDQPQEFIQKRLTHIEYNNIPFVKHEKVVEECVNSEILILVILKSQHNEGILTYKLFEYIGSKSYVLGIGPSISDVKEILDQLEAGKLFDYEDKIGFLDKFDNIYSKWQNGENIKNLKDVTEFSIPKICSKYSEVLESFEV